MTGTVESIPLITASILSKKLATGAQAVVFDVKTGNGAFMADPKDAERLGRALVDTTRATGRKASGYLTAMDRPIGEAVGNANEVAEAIRMLSGEGPADLREKSLRLAGRVIEFDPDVRGGQQRCDRKVRVGRRVAEPQFQP